MFAPTVVQYLLLYYMPAQLAIIDHNNMGRTQAQSIVVLVLSAIYAVNMLSSILLLNNTTVSAAHDDDDTQGFIEGSSKSDDDTTDGYYSIQTFFVKTSDIMADKMAPEFANYGKYNKYLKVNQIKSKFCLGYCVVLKVSTDDNTFFNKKRAVWPSRPEVDWVADALRNHLKEVYYIRFESYAEPPPTSDDDDKSSSQYEEIPKVLIQFNGNGSYSGGGGGNTKRR